MGDATPLLFIGVLVFAVAVLFWHYSRAERILQQWAQNRGHEILSKEIRWLRRGPFFWFTSRGQEVFYVTVRSPDGQLRRGWVRCGGWLLGMFSDAADVEWDE